MGTFQGFELPSGEFLSKTDHDPFSNEEYLKLQTILADSISPLGDYTFEEIVPGTGNPNEVDAVSSATLKDILDYIVPGAAYTTYRLWHMVHGNTSRIISHLSDSLYTESFAVAMLKTGKPAAQIWALQRLPRLTEFSEELISTVTPLTKHPNLNVSAYALMSLGGKTLNHPKVQEALVSHIAGGEYSLKKMAIQKLAQANVLGERVKNDLLGLAGSLNGDLLGELLIVFERHAAKDTASLRRISEILESDNNYKARKVLIFLEKINPSDALIRKRIKAFKKL